MTLRPIALVLLCASPVAAQTSIETGGGVGRLDRHGRGAFQSFRAQVHQAIGPARLAVRNTTIEHRGLGTYSRTDLDLQASLPYRTWEITVGPSVRLARGVDQPSARTVGATLALRHPLWGMDVIGRIQLGRAWYAGDQARWQRLELTSQATRGMLRIGSTLQQITLHETPAADAGPQPRALESMHRTAGVRSIQRVGAALGVRHADLTVDVQAGRQFVAHGASRPWWEGVAQLQVSSALAVVLQSSLAAGDPVLRMQGGRFASLGLRIGRPVSSQQVRPDPLAVEVTRLASVGAWRVRFAIPGARQQAHLYGDLTAWEPVELVRLEDGRWEAVLTARPGMYRINVAHDGGEWQVPPGLAAFADEFGSRVGLLRIPDL